MSRTKGKTIKMKSIALILAILMICTIAGTIFNCVFASNQKQLNFRGNGWGATSIDSDGWAVYDFGDKGSIKLKIAKTSDNVNYEYIATNSNYENNIQLDDGANQYKIAIQENITEGNEYSVLIDGTPVMIPGLDDGQTYKMYGLNSDEITANMLNLDVSCQASQPPFPGGGQEGGDPQPPQQMQDVKIWINGVNNGNPVIDDTANPPVVSYTGSNVIIKKGNYHAAYEIEFPHGGTTIGAIKAEGHGTIVINPAIQDLPGTTPAANTIQANGDGISISSTDSTSQIDFETFQGAGEGSLILEGGVETTGLFGVEDHNVQIGTQANKSSKGIKAGNVLVTYATLKMYCTGELFTGLTSDRKMNIDVQDEAKIDANTIFTGTALTNVNNIRLRCGGEVSIETAGEIGNVNKEVHYYDFVDFETTQQSEEMEDIVVMSNLTDGNGTAAGHNGKYEMTSTNSSLKLKSLSKSLWTLSFNILDAEGNIIEDTKVENGTVRVITACGIGRGADGRGPNDFRIEAGTPVTIQLLPDYGYQFTSGSINGTAITTAQEEVATYRFNMPAAHIHFSALFTKCDDSIVVNNDDIVGASIDNLAGQIKGTAEFKVEEAENVNAEKFKTAANGATIVGFTELSLNEVILKGTQSDAWKTPVTDLDEQMKVSLKVSDEIATELEKGASVGVLRDHNGEVSLLTATYNKDSRELEFNTDGYSTYAIAYNLKDTNTKVETTTTTAKDVKTGDVVLIVAIPTIILVILANVIIIKNRKK